MSGVGSVRTVLVLPSPPALLHPCSLVDPVADLRAACARAVAGLPPGRRTVVLAPPVSERDASRGVAEPLGHRVAAALLGDVPFERAVTPLEVPGDAQGAGLAATTLVVMADGSARRGEKAPGHVHPDAHDFDLRIERALGSGDAATLAQLDPQLGEELWCSGVPPLRALGEVARGRRVEARLLHAEATYGVAWWVARWDLDAAPA